MRGCWRVDAADAVGIHWPSSPYPIQSRPCARQTKFWWPWGHTREQKDGNVINQDPKRTDACSLCFAEFFNGGNRVFLFFPKKCLPSLARPACSDLHWLMHVSGGHQLTWRGAHTTPDSLGLLPRLGPLHPRSGAQGLCLGRGGEGPAPLRASAWCGCRQLVHAALLGCGDRVGVGG